MAGLVSRLELQVLVLKHPSLIRHPAHEISFHLSTLTACNLADLRCHLLQLLIENDHFTIYRGREIGPGMYWMILHGRVQLRRRDATLTALLETMETEQ